MYCAKHPAVNAARECVRCGGLHCLDCVRWVGNERKAIAACTRCDGVLRPLDVQVMAPAPDEARASLQRLRTPTGVASVAAIGLVTAMSDIPFPLLDRGTALPPARVTACRRCVDHRPATTSGVWRLSP